MTLQSLGKLLDDEKEWSVAARVDLHKGETSRFQKSDEGQMLVSVITHRGTEIWAILGGGPVWKIPPIGTEVMLTFNEGDYEGDVYLSARFADSPSGLNGVGALIVDDDGVEVRSDGGVAIPLATKADLQAVVDYLKMQFDPLTGHVHTADGGAPPTESVVGTGGSAPDPAGTSILKAE